MRQILRELANLTQRFVLGSPNDWCQQPVFNRDRHAKIDISVLYNRVAIEGGINPRNFHRRLHRRLQNEVVYRDFRSVRTFPGGLQLLACFHEWPGVDVDVEIKMGNRTEAFDQPLRNDFAHSGKLNTRTFAGLNGSWGGRFWSTGF